MLVRKHMHTCNIAAYSICLSQSNFKISIRGINSTHLKSSFMSISSSHESGPRPEAKKILSTYQDKINDWIHLYLDEFDISFL